ncbi:MAG: hypothetical protein PHF60_03380 [Candidatus ainarchaeum sp.]|nr:hypothetical protein [Candidatus ainarchaeum sp.]
MKLHMTRTRQRVAAKAEDLFTKTKQFLLLDTLFPPGLVPAFAGAGGMAPQKIPEEPLVQSTLQFATHGVQSHGTLSRRITDWAKIDVLAPGETTSEESGAFVTEAEAQKELARLLNGRAPTHEYIAYEAACLCNNPLVSSHTLHLVVGAAAEDFSFAPLESFTNLYASEPKRTFKSKRDLTNAIIPDASKIPSFLQGIFTLASRFWAAVTKGETEKDQLNRPYFAHFYDPSRDPDDRGLSLVGGEVRFQTAKDRAMKYWQIASDYYKIGNKPNAFCALGHLVHLISDMHVPAHVHNDIHGPNVVLGKPDSLENWLVRADYKHPDRKSNQANARIWSGKNARPPKPDRTWYDRNVVTNLGLLIEQAVSDTQQFRSVDKQGTRPDQKKTGKLSDEECFQQANHLIPGAISYSAQIIANFMDYHERGGKLVAAGWTPPKST